MDPTNFIARFQDGVRNNRFLVNLTFPAVAGGSDINDQFLVRAASLPPSKLGKITVRYQGREIPLPGDRVFDDWKVTCFNDNPFTLRNKFERWSNAINSHTSNVQLTQTGLLNYAVPATVQQLDRQDNVIKIYQMLYLWPQIVGEIVVDWDQQNAIETFDVTMSFVLWESDTTS